jgi:hypothetical protein
MELPGSWPGHNFGDQTARVLTVTLTLNRDEIPWCRDVFDVLAERTPRSNISTNDPMSLLRLILGSLQAIPRRRTYEAIFLRTVKRFETQLGGFSSENDWKEMVAIVDGFAKEGWFDDFWRLSRLPEDELRHLEQLNLISELSVARGWSLGRLELESADLLRGMISDLQEPSEAQIDHVRSLYRAATRDLQGVDNDQMGRALVGLGLLYWKFLTDPITAIKHFRKALTLDISSNDLAWIATATQYVRKFQSYQTNMIGRELDDETITIESIDDYLGLLDDIASECISADTPNYKHFIMLLKNQDLKRQPRKMCTRLIALYHPDRNLTREETWRDWCVEMTKACLLLNNC